jgi:hypothetical protein
MYAVRLLARSASLKERSAVRLVNRRMLHEQSSIDEQVETNAAWNGRDVVVRHDGSAVHIERMGSLNKQRPCIQLEPGGALRMSTGSGVFSQAAAMLPKTLEAPEMARGYASAAMPQDEDPVEEFNKVSWHTQS